MKTLKQILEAAKARQKTDDDNKSGKEDKVPAGGKTLTGQQHNEIDTTPTVHPLKEEQEGKHAVVTFGRMNPPTVGHEKLVDHVKKIAKEHKSEPHVFLSHSHDPKKNPLTYEHKHKLAHEAFGDAVKHIPKDHAHMLGVAKHMHGKADHLHMVVGSDRVDEVKKKLHEYNGKEGHYHFKSIHVHSAGSRDPDAEGTEGMSASKMRAHAHADEHDHFKSGLPDKIKHKSHEIMKAVKGTVKEELEEALNAQQRMKRAIQFKRIANRVQLGRERALRRRAPKDVLTKRSRRLAIKFMRNRIMRGAKYSELPYGTRAQIDQRLKKRKKSIGRIAQRLMPRVARAEASRKLGGAFKGINPTGAQHQKVTEEMLQQLVEQMLQMVNEDHDYEMTLAEQASLKMKAYDNDLPFDIVETVFRRGLAAWQLDEDTEIGFQQYAFNRVNSFIAGGAAADMDADLFEDLDPKNEPEDGHLDNHRDDLVHNVIGRMNTRPHTHCTEVTPPKATKQQIVKHIIEEARAEGANEHHIEIEFDEKGTYKVAHFVPGKLNEAAGDDTLEPHEFHKVLSKFTPSKLDHDTIQKELHHHLAKHGLYSHSDRHPLIRSPKENKHLIDWSRVTAHKEAKHVGWHSDTTGNPETTRGNHHVAVWSTQHPTHIRDAELGKHGHDESGRPKQRPGGTKAEHGGGNVNTKDGHVVVFNDVRAQHKASDNKDSHDRWFARIHNVRKIPEKGLLIPSEKGHTQYGNDVESYAKAKKPTRDRPKEAVTNWLAKNEKHKSYDKAVAHAKDHGLYDEKAIADKKKKLPVKESLEESLYAKHSEAPPVHAPESAHLRHLRHVADNSPEKKAHAIKHHLDTYSKDRSGGPESRHYNSHMAHAYSLAHGDKHPHVGAFSKKSVKGIVKEEQLDENLPPDQHELISKFYHHKQQMHHSMVFKKDDVIKHASAMRKIQDQHKAKYGRFIKEDAMAGEKRRIDMPQLTDFHAFKKDLEDSGHKMTDEVRKPEHLEPSQKHFNQEKVDRLISSGAHKDKPIIVSHDDQIVDGHHRWEACRQAGCDVKTRKTSMKADELFDFVKGKPYVEKKGLHEQNT